MKCMEFLNIAKYKVPLSFTAVLIFGTCSVYGGYASFLKNLSDMSPKSIGDIYARLSSDWRLFEQGYPKSPLVVGGPITAENIAEQQGCVGKPFWRHEKSVRLFKKPLNRFWAEAYFLYLAEGSCFENGEEQKYYFECEDFWSLIDDRKRTKKEKDERREDMFPSDKLAETRKAIWRCLCILANRDFLSSVFGLEFIPTLIKEYNEESDYPTVLFRCVFISENQENFREGKFEKISCDDLSKPPQRMIVKMIIKQEHAEKKLEGGEYIKVPYDAEAPSIEYDRDVADLDVCLEFCWDIGNWMTYKRSDGKSEIKWNVVDRMDLRKVRWNGTEMSWNSQKRLWQ